MDGKIKFDQAKLQGSSSILESLRVKLEKRIAHFEAQIFRGPADNSELEDLKNLLSDINAILESKITS